MKIYGIDMEILLSMASSTIVALSVVIGGTIGLRRYRRSLDIKAADLLLDMEAEFRQIRPTLLRLEILRSYRSDYQGPIGRALTMAPLSGRDIERIDEVERSLRFFFLCTVLHLELRVEQSVLARSYYWHARMLIHREKRPELCDYVSINYRRLFVWLTDNEESFKFYEKCGKWRPKFARRSLASAQRIPSVSLKRPLPGRRVSDSTLSLHVLQDYRTHCELVDQLEQSLGKHFRASIEDWFGNRSRLSHLAEWCAFAAFDEVKGRYVGICGYYTHRGDVSGRFWLGWFAVLPCFRRKGVGSEMLAEITRILKERRANELWVYTSPNNDVALSFYARNQFTRKGTFGELGLTQDASKIDSVTLSIELQGDRS